MRQLRQQGNMQYVLRSSEIQDVAATGARVTVLWNSGHRTGSPMPITFSLMSSLQTKSPLCEHMLLECTRYHTYKCCVAEALRFRTRFSSLDTHTDFSTNQISCHLKTGVCFL